MEKGERFFLLDEAAVYEEFDDDAVAAIFMLIVERCAAPVTDMAAVDRIIYGTWGDSDGGDKVGKGIS